MCVTLEGRMNDRIIRIGGGAGFWGDAPSGPRQLIASGVDYLMLDYLAEVTMSILARAYAKSPSLGYATDFVTQVVAPNLEAIIEGNVRVVTNAGGINPLACRDALVAAAREQGITLDVEVVLGDNLLERADALRRSACPDLPDNVMSVNAYLGATPIAAALDRGARIVITGRCVDSALALGPLIHEFGWSADDLDRMAAGTLAGHLLECGAQSTGGNFTDWDSVTGWENAGYPIAECRADGSFALTKPPGTGGLVCRGSVSEQLLYEIGDPAAYVVPDVTCDFTEVTIRDDGPDRVEVAGARGRPPSDKYKVSATYRDGYRGTAILTIAGDRALDKAMRMAEAILAKTRVIFRERNLPDYKRTAIHPLGTEAMFGAHANPALRETREVVLRIDVHNETREAVEIFGRELVGAGLCMAPGRCGLVGGRPKASPVVRLFSFLIAKNDVPVEVTNGRERTAVPVAPGQPLMPRAAPPAAALIPPGPTRRLPLRTLAWARSGDKGNDANIGVIARDPAYYDALRAALTAELVQAYFAHYVEGHVERFELPGAYALNFLLHDALRGGGVASMLNDSQGKTLGQQILDMPVDVPEVLLQDADPTAEVAT